MEKVNNTDIELLKRPSIPSIKFIKFMIETQNIVNENNSKKEIQEIN